MRKLVFSNVLSYAAGDLILQPTLAKPPFIEEPGFYGMTSQIWHGLNATHLVRAVALGLPAYLLGLPAALCFMSSLTQCQTSRTGMLYIFRLAASLAWFFMCPSCRTGVCVALQNGYSNIANTYRHLHLERICCVLICLCL